MWVLHAFCFADSGDFCMLTWRRSRKTPRIIVRGAIEAPLPVAVPTRIRTIHACAPVHDPRSGRAKWVVHSWVWHVDSWCHHGRFLDARCFCAPLRMSMHCEVHTRAAHVWFCADEHAVSCASL